MNRRVLHDQIARKDDPSRPAVLHAIVYISKDGYHMSPCSDWDPFYEHFGIEFKNTKASAIAQDPGVPELQGDFVNVCQFIGNAANDQLRKDGMGKGESNPLQRTWDGDCNGFRIQHKLFRASFHRLHPAEDSSDMTIVQVGQV